MAPLSPRSSRRSWRKLANPLEAKVALSVKEGATSLSASLFLQTTFGVVADTVKTADDRLVVSVTFRVDYMTVEQILAEVKHRIGKTAEEYDGVEVTLWFPNFNPPQTHPV